MEASRSTFDTYINGARLLTTRAPQWLFPFWYAKEPMFWLPYGWFPYYAEWLLSFPRAPMGSVSIASWQVACTIFIGIVSQMVVSVFRLAVGTGTQTPAAKQAVKVPAAGKASTPAAKTEEKKEL
jgi:tail-anchored protein insertion receptor